MAERAQAHTLLMTVHKKLTLYREKSTLEWILLRRVFPHDFSLCSGTYDPEQESGAQISSKE